MATCRAHRFRIQTEALLIFQVMAQSAIDKIPPGPKLDALTAEKVFGKIARRKMARKSGEWLNPHIMRKNF
jgi:hypothetical protein